MLISISGSYIGSTLTVRSQFDTAFSIRECKPYRVPIRCFFLSSLTSGLGKLPAGYRKCTSSYWLIDEEEMLALIATAFTKVTTGHIVRQHLFVYRPKLTPAVESRTYIRQSVFWCTLSTSLEVVGSIPAIDASGSSLGVMQETFAPDIWAHGNVVSRHPSLVS